MKNLNLITVVKDYIILRFVFKKIKKVIPLNLLTKLHKMKKLNLLKILTGATCNLMFRLLWSKQLSLFFKVLCYLQSEKIWVAFLQNKYMFAKNYHLHWIAGRANIPSKYIIYIFFNFRRGFCGFFPMLFPKAPPFCCKKNWTNFCCIILLYLWTLKVCLRLLKSYLKLEIWIFLSFVVSFLVDMFK